MSQRVAFGLAIAAVALLAWRPNARAYTCITSSCPVWCDEAVYGLSIASEDLGESTTVSEVQRGMDDWSAVACTGLETRYTGRTNATAGAGDGESVIGWVESGWNESSSTIGVTGPRWNPRTGCIGEADMRMNGVHFTWTTEPGSGSRVNAYSIVLHEGGHYYGLGHSDDSDATMFFAYGGGVSSLEADDRAGICELYPGDTMPPPDDCTVTGCPAGEECEDGECVPEPEPECTGDGDCDDDEVCDTDAGTCEPAPDERVGLGEPCDTSSDCLSGLCVSTPSGTVCSEQCDAFDPSSCPGGFYCNGDAGGTCDTGLCFAGTGGGGGLGDACDDDTDCASLVCDGGRCSELCTPDGAADCPDGFACQQGSTPGCGACKAVVGVGEPCEVDDDCASRICLESSEEDSPFCSRTCASDADCPDDLRCRDLGPVALCDRPGRVADGGARGGDGGPTSVDQEVRVLEGDCGCTVPGAGKGAPQKAATALMVLALLLLGRLARRGRR